MKKPKPLDTRTSYPSITEVHGNKVRLNKLDAHRLINALRSGTVKQLPKRLQDVAKLYIDYRIAKTAWEAKRRSTTEEKH